MVVVLKRFKLGSFSLSIPIYFAMPFLAAPCNFPPHSLVFQSSVKILEIDGSLRYSTSNILRSGIWTNDKYLPLPSTKLFHMHFDKKKLFHVYD